MTTERDRQRDPLTTWQTGTPARGKAVLNTTREVPLVRRAVIAAVITAALVAIVTLFMRRRAVEEYSPCREYLLADHEGDAMEPDPYLFDIMCLADA